MARRGEQVVAKRLSSFKKDVGGESDGNDGKN